MKNFSFFILFSSFFFLFLISSCSSDDSLSIMEQENPEMQGEDFTAEMRQQWHPGQWWTPCEAENLVLFVDPCFLNPARADAFQGLNDAVDAYNNAPDVGINITMVFDINDPRINVTIECDDNKAANGCVNAIGGNLIGIDTNGPPTPGCPINICFHTNTIMHELGHILGFGHTNVATDGVTIAGTTVGNNSVFVTQDCNSTICAFSAGDLLALQTQYPCGLCRPRGRITGPSTLCELGEEATFCFGNGAVVVDSWDIPNNMTIVNINADQSCVTVSLDIPSNGNSTLEVNVNTGACIQVYDRVIETYTGRPNFDINWNGPVCLGDVVTFTLNLLPSSQELKVIEWTFSGALSEMSSQNEFSVAEASYSGTGQVCAKAINPCEKEHTYCRTVIVKPSHECGGKGDIKNPK